MKRGLIFICNALDDETRLRRLISTDSPAASKKIIDLCSALRLNKVRPIILSMGRGGGIKEWRFFGSSVRRVKGIPVTYIPFITIPFLSQFLSSLLLIYAICKYHFKGYTHIIFYNRTQAYLPSLVMATLLGYKNILDLEDGEISEGKNILYKCACHVTSKLFDKFCNCALLACSALESVTSIKPVLCYYGTVLRAPIRLAFQSHDVRVLMSGTLNHDTGADLLIEVIELLRRNQPSWSRNIIFEIAGKGESLEQLKLLESESDLPRVLVHGRLSSLEYLNVLNKADVGLSLKLNEGSFAKTTFPSKIIEYASAGLLVLTTDISDVRLVLGNGAIYLEADDASLMISLLKSIVLNPQEALNLALIGSNAVQEICMPEVTGKKLTEFLFQ